MLFNNNIDIQQQYWCYSTTVGIMFFFLICAEII